MQEVLKVSLGPLALVMPGCTAAGMDTGKQARPCLGVCELRSVTVVGCPQVLKGFNKGRWECGVDIARDQEERSIHTV